MHKLKLILQNGTEKAEIIHDIVVHLLCFCFLLVPGFDRGRYMGYIHERLLMMMMIVITIIIMTIMTNTTSSQGIPPAE